MYNVYIYIYIYIHRYIYIYIYRERERLCQDMLHVVAQVRAVAQVETMLALLHDRAACGIAAVWYQCLWNKHTHPTCCQCRTSPILPNVNVHGRVRWVQSVCEINTRFLWAAVGHLSANFERRSGHWKHQRRRDECLFHRHRYRLSVNSALVLRVAECQTMCGLRIPFWGRYPP